MPHQEEIKDMPRQLFLALDPYRPCLLPPKKHKNFQNFPSHRIFKRMHGVLNIDENKN